MNLSASCDSLIRLPIPSFRFNRNGKGSNDKTLQCLRSGFRRVQTLPPLCIMCLTIRRFIRRRLPVYSQEINVTVTPTAARRTGIAGWGAANYYSVR
jgi:hypothetical protein